MSEIAFDEIIDKTYDCMNAGDMAQALELIEPLARTCDELVESGTCQDNDESVYFNFSSPKDEIVWRVHTDDTRTAEQATEPFCQVYFMYGSALYEAERYEEAIASLEKALRWNPSNLTVRFEIGENYKKLGDMDAYERVLNDAYPYIASAADMARYHRSKGFLLVERENYRLAAAHLTYSLRYDESEFALNEITYIKERCGEDYSNMTPAFAGVILQQAGDPYGADEDTLGALSQLIRIAMENSDMDTAIRAAIDLYQLTGNEDARNLAGTLIEAVKEASGNE